MRHFTTIREELNLCDLPLIRVVFTWCGGLNILLVLR